MSASNPRYQSGRPFLVISMRYTPRQGVPTSRPGWQALSGAVEAVEVPRLVERLTDKLVAGADFILDLLADRVVKNRLATTELADPKGHFCAKYATEIAAAIAGHTRVEVTDAAR